MTASVPRFVSGQPRTDHRCVLDYLVDAGLTREEAAHVAWEHTCFPLDCELAVAQASEWLAANRPAKAGEKGG